MRGRLLIGALIGSATGSLIWYAASMVTALLILGTTGEAIPRLDDTLGRTLGVSPLRLFVLATIAASCAFGGYVAARISTKRHLLAGALASWLFVIPGLVTLVARAQSGFARIDVGNVLLFACLPMCGAFGGYIRSRKQAVTARS